MGRINALAAAWIPDGTGAPNATPTINPVRLLPDLLSLIDPIFAFNATLAIIAIVTVTGLYAFARALGCCRDASVAAATIYLSSELFVNKLAAGHEIYLLSAAVLPAVGAAAVSASRRPTWRRAALLGVLLFFSFAQLQFVIFSSVVALGFLLGRPTTERLKATLVAFCVALLLSLPTAASLIVTDPSDLGIQRSIPLYFASQSVPLAQAMVGDGYIGGYSHAILTSMPAPVTWCAWIVAIAGIVGLLLNARRSRAAVVLLLIAFFGLSITLGVHGVFSSLLTAAYGAFHRMSFLRELYDGLVLYELAVAVGVGLLISGTRYRAALAIATWFAIFGASAPLWLGHPLAVVPFVRPSDFQLPLPSRTGERILTLPGFTPQTFKGTGLGFPPPVGTPQYPDIAAGNLTPASYAGIALAAESNARGSLLERLGVTIVARDRAAAFAPARVLRPGLRSRLPAHKQSQDLSPHESAGVFSVSQRPGVPLLRIGMSSVPFESWQSLPRETTTVALDEPGTAALANYTPHTDDPSEDWIDVRVAPWLDGARFVGPQFGILTMRASASYTFRDTSQRALLVLPPCGAVVKSGDRTFHLTSHGSNFAWYALPEGRTRVLQTCSATAISEESAVPPLINRQFETTRLSFRCGNLVNCRGALDRGGLHLLTLNQQFDPRLMLSIDGHGEVTHLRADGFGNAWIVRSSAPTTFSIYYAPYRRVRLLEILSLAGYLIGAAALIPRRALTRVRVW